MPALDDQFQAVAALVDVSDRQQTSSSRITEQIARPDGDTVRRLAKVGTANRFTFVKFPMYSSSVPNQFV